MSFLKDLISSNKEAIIDSIFDEDLQAKLVAKLNANVDIPFLSEKTEAKIMNALYDSVEDIMKEVMREKL
tara:strand:+ start:452 stop:661 length:210 start_codon:yes stop_codon:yes gene_type:complete